MKHNNRNVFNLRYDVYYVCANEYTLCADPKKSRMK